MKIPKRAIAVMKIMWKRFGSMILNEPTPEQELDFYFTLNFGGTAHTKADLEKIMKCKSAINLRGQRQ